VAEVVDEPYRTLLLLHAKVKMRRSDLSALRMVDIEVDGPEVRLSGNRLQPDGVPILRSYLRHHLARVDSPYLFPLPSDHSKPANEGVAKKKLARVAKGDTTPAR